MLALFFALAAESTAADRFLDELSRALARQDKAAVAGMFEYPAMVMASGLRMPVIDRASLILMYDAVFSPALEGVVAMARVARSGQPAPVYRVTLSADGLMIGPSWIWARRSGARYRIARIIVPGGGLAMPVRRIALGPGQSSALFSGRLLPFEMQSYIISAKKGQRLQLKLDGFAAREAVLRVLDLRSGAPMDDEAGEGTRLWSGAIEENADYRIDVLRLAPESKPAPMYVLSVGLR